MTTSGPDTAWNDMALGIPVEPAPSWQSKGRCYYTDNGVLMVDYEDMPAMDVQGWDSGTPQTEGYYYTSEAVSTQHCSKCNRSFASASAVLNHLKDHASHRERPESYEAAYFLNIQEEGYYPPAIPAAWNPHMDYMMQMPVGMGWPCPADYWGPGEEFQVMAPPSDIYSGSEAGSGSPPEENYNHISSGVAQPSTPEKASAPHGHDGHATRANASGKPTRGSRTSNRAGHHHGHGHHSRHAPPPPPRPEDEAAFPPLPSTGGKAAHKGLGRKWGAPANPPATASPSGSSKLRADAVEYQPCGSPVDSGISNCGSVAVAEVAVVPEPGNEKKEVEAEPVPTPTTPKQALRVSAPAWAPTPAAVSTTEASA